MRIVFWIVFLLPIGCGFYHEDKVAVPPEPVNQCSRYDSDSYQCFLADRVCYIYDLSGRERVICR